MKRKIVFIIVACLFINSSAFVAGIDIQFDNSSYIVHVSVLQAISLIRLPIEIFNNLISKEAPFSPEYKQPSKSKNDNKNSKNRKCSNFLFFESNREIRLNSRTTSLENSTTICFQNVLLNTIAMNDWLFHPFPGPCVWFLVFLLIYLITLSKSNLPWEISKLFLEYNPVTPIAFPGFLFVDIRCQTSTVSQSKNINN
jgi:hypothetical protein